MYGSCASSNVIPIQRGGNCFFLAVSYFMCNTEDRNSDLRSSTVNKIINEWQYKDFIEDLSMVNRAEVYKNIFS